jgi:RND family efflux transporter MFP subunit
MKTFFVSLFGLILGVLAVRALTAPAADVPPATAKPAPGGLLEVPGRTHLMLARRGIIAPAILRPVTEVLVGPGDRVTKGQVLVRLFDLEPQAKIRAREEELKGIEAKAQYSRRNLELAENGRRSGALPENTYNEIRAAALSNDAQMRAAEAELTLAQSELRLYSVTATIDGEIAWLDVSPGTVSWPGSLIWGEIVDVRELEVRCELSTLQVEHVAAGQPAEVWIDGKAEAAATGSVVLVGKVADRSSGFVPIVIRVPNGHERLRAEQVVKVRFPAVKGP